MADILKNLNPEQQKAVCLVKGPILVLAGAGTGKTRTLTHRIAYLIEQKNIKPRNILAVTFTNKAADEMKQRIKELVSNTGALPQIGTFHAVCANILRREIGALGFKDGFTIFDTQDQKKAITQVLKTLEISKKDFNIKLILNLIQQAKQEMILPDDFLKHFDNKINSPLLEVVAAVYKEYQQYLKIFNALDFGDLIFKTVLIWQKNSQILKKYQNQWHYLLVDEYQDTNLVQSCFCSLLAGKNKNIFVVGDDCQSIYGFRGANLANILNFEKDYKGARVFLLEQNYRSTQKILDFANAIITPHQSKHKKLLWTDKKKGNRPKLVQVSDEKNEGEYILDQIGSKFSDLSKKQKLSNKSTELEIEYDYSDSKPQDSRLGILDKILTTNKKSFLSRPNFKPNLALNFDQINLNKYVVLYRTNAQSRALEETLLYQEVPYRIIGGIKFYERKEIKDILAYLKFLANPFDFVSLARLSSAPPCGVGDKTLFQIIQYLKKKKIDFFEFAHNLDHISTSQISANIKKRISILTEFFILLNKKLDFLAVEQIIDLIIQQSGYLKYLKNTTENFKERQENISELKTVASRVKPKKGLAALEDFLQQVSLATDLDNLDSQKNALTLMTVHAAKGLEFDCVFLAGAEQGLFPHSSSLDNKEQLEEERRLFYVAATRAIKDLHILYTQERTLYGSSFFPEPSEFLRAIDDDLVHKTVYNL